MSYWTTTTTYGQIEVIYEYKETKAKTEKVIYTSYQ